MEHHRDWQKESWEWLQFAASLPAMPIPLPSLAASQILYSGRCLLTGYSLQNNGTAAGGVNLLNGQDTTGLIAVILPLTAQQAVSNTAGTMGVLMDMGVYAQITTAVIRGSVYIVPLEHLPFTMPGH